MYRAPSYNWVLTSSLSLSSSRLCQREDGTSDQMTGQGWGAGGSEPIPREIEKQKESAGHQGSKPLVCASVVPSDCTINI